MKKSERNKNNKNRKGHRFKEVIDRRTSEKAKTIKIGKATDSRK